MVFTSATDAASRFGNGWHYVRGQSYSIEQVVLCNHWVCKKYLADYCGEFDFRNLSLNCIAFCNDRFVAIGSVYEQVNGSYKYVYYMITSKVGVTWTTKEPLKNESCNAVTNIYGIVAMP